MFRKTLSLILISLFISSCDLVPPKQPKEDLGEVYRDYYPSGKLKSVCQVKGTKRDGICKYYTEKGVLAGTAEFKDNEHHGKAIHYYEDGKIKGEVEYLNNKREGYARIYYKNGKINTEEVYSEGELTGVKKKFYENGQLMMENEFKNGKPSVNLKEYTEKGELILDKPQIIVQAIDRVALENKYILKLSLSNKSQRVQFYLGTLTDNKFMPVYAKKIDSKNGVGTYEVTVYRGTTIMEKLNIIATKKTKLDNTQILTTSYNLAVKY